MAQPPHPPNLHLATFIYENHIKIKDPLSLYRERLDSILICSETWEIDIKTMTLSTILQFSHFYRMHQISFWNTWKLNQRCARSTCKTGLVFFNLRGQFEKWIFSNINILIKACIDCFHCIVCIYCRCENCEKELSAHPKVKIWKGKKYCLVKNVYCF